ncbi:Natural resistance-associated macrophage protein [Posidoniimonas corsicana]|uniref:Natural resistance-associated macrophage protein n=1 Tax=Posidoniimonas corsicana TaxID=1938618 RepID=A0A5C5VJI4_9BACT|nr:divalent metal cation transporter [Posidoniimonas corsicana]TWT38090.1 Natural resistance-associated macrophage protein [Posidoniimonas corsicana]
MADTSAAGETGVERDRRMLAEANAAGAGARLKTYVRLSGPGWLQSAITLGGGSLAGALFLGILGGPSMLWLQLVAIVLGVVMLSAISYVTLSTGERPFGMINQHINPVLGWGWLIATMMANIIWCMPQFGLCFEALEQNLGPAVVGDVVQSTPGWKYGVSFVLLAVAMSVLMLSIKGGATAKLFDVFLKALIGMIVLCFFGVVIKLSLEGLVDWGAVLAGFLPDLDQTRHATGDLKALADQLPEEAKQFWESRLVREQRDVMIGAAATAVGINMTFLMPYSLLQRGWDKTFRGLARFDLSTGMAIPYVLVTSCVVIAASQAFHATADDQFLSTDPAQFQESPLFAATEKNLLARVRPDQAAGGLEGLEPAGRDEAIAAMAALPEEEKRLAASLVRRNAFSLSRALEPLLGQELANLVFGLGIFGMGFSTIIILMMINGFVFREAFGQPTSNAAFFVGALVAGVCGALWPYIWRADAQMWLAIFASSFGIMLLPIAYATFFMMMNSRKVLGDDMPRGLSRAVWNVMMVVAVVGAVAAAATSIYNKVSNPNPDAAFVGQAALGVSLAYLAAVVVGFFIKPKPLEAIGD